MRFVNFGSLVTLAALCAASIAATAPAAHAQVIPDRPTLNALLGGSAITEGFENYTIANGDAQDMGVSTLNSTAVVNGQGPGLVVPGVNFIAGQTTLQWNGNNYFALPTQTIVSNGGSTLRIDFTSPQSAYGLDLLAFQGFPYSATVITYASNDTTVLNTTSGITVSGPSPVFYGFQNVGGIGAVDVIDNNHVFSPVIDNVTFGAAGQGASAAPEPATVALFAAGFLPAICAVLRRRKR